MSRCRAAGRQGGGARNSFESCVCPPPLATEISQPSGKYAFSLPGRHGIVIATRSAGVERLVQQDIKREAHLCDNRQGNIFCRLTPSRHLGGGRPQPSTAVATAWCSDHKRFGTLPHHQESRTGIEQLSFVLGIPA